MNIENFQIQDKEPGKRTLVAIPYISKGAQGRELEFAIKGWLRHFSGDLRLVVIGDRDPVLDRYPEVLHIEQPRVEGVPGEYLPALDVAAKTMAIIRKFPEEEGFVWAADDIYAVNDFDLADIKFLKMLEPDLRFSRNDNNPWKRMMAKTRSELLRLGFPTRNHALHLPSWYRSEWMKELIDVWDMTRSGYSLQSMYYNIYYKDRIPFQLDKETDNIKFGVYTGAVDEQQLRRAFRTKIWLNNSGREFSPLLERLLDEHFGKE